MKLLDPQQIRQAWQLLVEPGAVTEIRVIGAMEYARQNKPCIVAGYFTEPEPAIAALGKLHSWHGAYIIPSPIDPILLARGQGALKRQDRGALTQDADILRRRWLMVDIDAVRRGANGQKVSDIPATESERHAATSAALEIAAWLTVEHGWPEPVRTDSGNGAWLLYRCDLPTAHPGPQAVLQVLAERYSDSQVDVDKTVYNPSRITRLPGTMACKGADTADRPWRMGRVVDVPLDLAELTETQIASVTVLATPATPPAAAAATRATPATNAPVQPGAGFDPLALLAAQGLDPGPAKKLGDGGSLHVLGQCPCERQLCDGTATVTIASSGAVGLQCKHATCDYSEGARKPGESWKAWRALHDTSLGQRTAPHDRDAAVSEASQWAAQWGGNDPLAAMAAGAAPQPDLPDHRRPPRRTDDGRAIVCSTDDWRDQRDQVLAAVLADPRVYLSSDSIAVLGHSHQMLPLSLRDGSLDSAIVDRVAVVTIRRDQQTGELVQKPSSLSPRVVGMVAAAAKLPEQRAKLREVVAVTSSPVYAPDGELFCSDGWSVKTKTLIVDCAPVELPASMGAAHSLAALRDLFADFPWESQACVDNVIAAMLTPLVRPMINGGVPFLGITGNTQGVGKSKIAEVIMAVHGMVPETTTMHEDRKDFADGLLVKLKRAAQIITYDNIKHRVDSPEFENILTSGRYSDRIKGLSEDGVYDVRALFILTGNGMSFSPDMVRRGMIAGINDASSNPTARQVRIPNLPRWAAENRGEILSHLCQMVQDWIAAGMPSAEPLDKSFSDFCTVVGGIMTFAGGSFWANQSAARNEMRDDHDWGILLAEMCRRGEWMAPKELHGLCVSLGCLGDVLGGGSDHQQVTRLGKALARKVNSVMHGYRLGRERNPSTQQSTYRAESLAQMFGNVVSISDRRAGNE